MTDITVSRELLRQAIDTIGYYASVCNEDDQDTPAKQAQAALRAALEQPAPVQEPMFWVRLRSDGMYEGPIHNAQIEKVRKESGGWTPLYTAPQAQQPDRIAQLEAANTNLFEQGQKMHKRIQELEAAPVQEQQAVAWCITCNGQFTGNLFGYREAAEVAMIELNRKYPTDKRTIEPLFAAQPRKAVKLSDSEILAALEVEYVSSAQNRELFLSDARIIEAAVWARLGVTE